MEKKFNAGVTITFVLVLLILPFLNATVIAAPASHEDFEVTMTFSNFISLPEKNWVDDEGAQHVRGLVAEFIVSGDIEGNAILTENWNYVNWESGLASGDAQCKGTITSMSGEVYLIYADATIITGVSSGTFMIHGTGDCKGVHITGTVSSPAPGVVELDGTITTK